MSSFRGYEHLINQLILGDGQFKKKAASLRAKITQLPREIFSRFKHLVNVNLCNQRIAQLPPGLSAAHGLQCLNIAGNPLSQLPADFDGCVDSLEEFDMSGTAFLAIPDVIFDAKNLLRLRANHTAITELSSRVGKLKKLQVLSLSATGLAHLPQELAECQELEQLYLSGIPWIHKNLLSIENLHEYYEEHPITAAFSREVSHTAFSREVSRTAFSRE